MHDDHQPGSGGKVLELFEQGKQFTEELLRENEKQRRIIAALRAEKQQLEKQYIEVDVPRMRDRIELLEKELRRVREENGDLKGQFVSVEEENREFADRYVEVQRQNSDLIHLYVASYRLHSTVDYDEVVKIIKEIVINMIGSEVFGIYAVDEGKNQLALLDHEGLDELGVDETILMGEGPVGAAAKSGELFTSVPSSNGSPATGAPLAVIPLRVGQRTLGVIAVYQLLPQKHGFRAVDFELFELLGGHAATALYVSKLYSASERKRNTLEGFIDLLKSNPGGEPSGR